MNVTVIMPTIGRATLETALASLGPAGLWPDDCVYVIGDGVDVSDRLGGLPCPIEYGIANPPTRMVGNALRNWVLDRIEGRDTAIAFLDDDDGFTPGAIDRVRRDVAADKTRLHIYRFVYADGRGVYWQDKSIRLGNVGTPMMAIHAGAVGGARWTSAHASDYWWAVDLTGRDPERAVWHEDVQTVVRPHLTERGRQWLEGGYS